MQTHVNLIHKDFIKKKSVLHLIVNYMKQVFINYELWKIVKLRSHS